MNEKAKVVLGFVVSIGFAVTGHFQIKKDRLVLRRVLVGGAIPILILTTFAMHSLYHLAGPTLAFILKCELDYPRDYRDSLLSFTGIRYY